MRISKNFNSVEFKCKCDNPICKGKKIRGLTMFNICKLITPLEILRKEYGVIYINSGKRCLQHNIDVGGKRDSQHLSGKAVDIYIPGIFDSESPVETMMNWLLVEGFISYWYRISSKNYHIDVRY